MRMRDLQNAVPLYRAALASDTGLHDAWRGLGLALMRSGNTEEGRSAISTFLERVPDTGDAAMLRSMIGPTQ